MIKLYIIKIMFVKENEMSEQERIKKKEWENKYLGKKIKIISMEGEPQYTNKEGVVERVDDAPQLWGTWGGLAVIPDKDQVEIIK